MSGDPSLSSLSSIVFPTDASATNSFAASLASHVAASSSSSSSSSSISSRPRKIYSRTKRNATSAELVDVDPKASSLSPSFAPLSSSSSTSSTFSGSFIPSSLLASSFIDGERNGIAAAAAGARDAINQFQGATKRALDEQSRMAEQDDGANAFVVGDGHTTKTFTMTTHMDNRVSSSTNDDLSFLDMIERFAVTAVTDNASSHDMPPERCPLCAKSVPLLDFASHVYVCMREREDAELAQKLAAESGASQSTDEYKPVDICPHGAACSRTDANHFIMLQHPPATCMICNEEWPVFEINAHVTLCLTKGDFSRGIGEGKKSNRGGLDLGGSQTSSSMITTNDSFNRSPLPSSSSSLSSSSMGSSTSISSHMSMPLSRAQMSVMANLVVRKKKEKAMRQPATVTRSRSAGQLSLSLSTPTSDADKADEASISQLLDTFAHLGFNKESLARVMNEDAATHHHHHGANTAERASSPPSAPSVTPLSSFGNHDWPSSSSSSISSITVPQPIALPGVGSPLLQPSIISSSNGITLSPLRAPIPMTSLSSATATAASLPSGHVTPLISLPIIGLPAVQSTSPPSPPSGLTIITTLPTSSSAPTQPDHI